MRPHRLILLLWLGGPALAAQEPAATLEAERYPSWRTSYFPYLRGAANDGPMLVFRVRHWRPSEYEERTTYDAAFNFDAGITGRGSRFVSAQFKAPNLWQGWRLAAQATAERQVRYGFFGLGNGTVSDDDLVTEENPFLYRMRRSRYRASAEVTHQLKGSLHLALLTEYEHTHFTSLPGQSAFVSEFPSGELNQDDLSGRLALVYDTRDNEYNTQRGLLLEAGTQVGSGGDGYTRQYALFRGYLPLREGTVVAARIGGSGMGGTPPLDARFVLPGWENQVPVARRRVLQPRPRYRTAHRQGDAVRQPRGAPRPALARRPGRGDAAGVRGRGAGVRGGVVPAHHRKHEGRRRRRGGAPDPALQHLRLQLRRRVGGVQLLRRHGVDVLAQATLAGVKPAISSTSRMVVSPWSRAYHWRTCG